MTDGKPEDVLFELSTPQHYLRIGQEGSTVLVSCQSPDRRSGWERLTFGASMVTASQTTTRRDHATHPDHATARLLAARQEGEGVFVLELGYPPLPVEERVTIRLLSSPAAMVIERVIVNRGQTAQVVYEVRTETLPWKGQVTLDGHGAGSLKVVHVGNLRQCRRRAWWSRGPWVSPVPDCLRTYGDSEGYFFGAIAIADGQLRNFLVEAALQQEVFKHFWSLQGRFVYGSGGSIFEQYSCVARDSRPEQPLVLEPGREQLVSAIFYQVVRDRDLQDVYDDYLAVLNERYELHGRRSPLLHQALYCTWNYTFYRDISHDILRRQCEFIRDRLPGVKHFLIDDGYQPAENRPSYDMGRFYPEPGANFDRAKFPQGMRAVSDMIRAHGLVPSIWWSPAMGRLNRLVAEHPEWLCYDEGGGDWSMDSGEERKAALDFSAPEARAFVQRVLETIFVEWGFEGMKLDFCTYPFDSKDIRFRNGGGVRWWNWLLATVARHIPPHGIFQLCGAAPYGDLFIGRWCDNHRIGGDIGKGEWEQHVSTSRAPLPMLGVPGRSGLLMDVDSAGIRQDLSDEANLARLNWCHITQGVMGLGGDLTQLGPRQAGWLRRITTGCDRGYKVRCPDRRAFTGTPLPEALYVDYPPDSPTARSGVTKEICFFNWEDQPRTVGYAPQRLGLSGTETIVDYWTGQPIPLVEGQLVAFLKGRESRLMQVKNS